jgi:hypothetical protein
MALLPTFDPLHEGMEMALGKLRFRVNTLDTASPFGSNGIDMAIGHPSALFVTFCRFH